jgi:hypothetical protein
MGSPPAIVAWHAVQRTSFAGSFTPSASAIFAAFSVRGPESRRERACADSAHAFDAFPWQFSQAAGPTVAAETGAGTPGRVSWYPWQTRQPSGAFPATWQAAQVAFAIGAQPRSFF